MSGLWHSSCAWFWGVDRLDHLGRSLIRQRLNIRPKEKPVFDRTWANLGKDARAMPDAKKWHTRAVNAEGTRSETDADLKMIVERAGLDWLWVIERAIKDNS